jgi:Zn-dependent peptidase ImmA (M78 family)/DNA-binding XRE family transcriptional regulator
MDFRNNFLGVFMIGTPGFIGQRLAQAREARGLTGVALADLLQVDNTSISNYEKDRQSPTAKVMERMVDVLKVPPAFFLRPLRAEGKEFWWRSLSSATKSARSRAKARNMWLQEIISYLQEYLEFPKLNVPDFNLPDDVHKISTSDIEDIAMECRRVWRLGSGPIADTVLILENNGIIVSRGELGAETLDAYSQAGEDQQHPVIFLGADKATAARSRHDASHELGHLLLHRHVDPAKLRHPIYFKLIEEQAHRFASAFNLPAQGFADQLWYPSIEAFLALKPHWKSSIAAMIVRCAQLDILSEEQARRMWIAMSRRGWRKQEPLDDRMAPEQPRLLRRSIELLVKEGVKTTDQILTDLALSAFDIESLACLDSGYLSYEPTNTFGMPQLRQDIYPKNGTDNVIRFALPRK